MTCDDCRFYRPNEAESERSTCHRHPPKVFIYPVTLAVGLEGIASFTAWPEPPEPRWCGEFEPPTDKVPG